MGRSGCADVRCLCRKTGTRPPRSGTAARCAEANYPISCHLTLGKTACDVKRRLEMFVDVGTAPDLTPMMRTTIFCAALLLVGSMTGCFWRRDGAQPKFSPINASGSSTSAPDTNNVFTITPAEGADGRIASVNANLNFAV